jgi:hypothetical protein
MESPPPYQQKKKSTGLIVGLIIGGVLVCCGLPILALGGAAFWGFNKVGPMAKCGISIELMRNAVVAFADDNGGKLPTAATWQDQIKPYYAKELTRKKVKENPFGTISPEGEWGCEAEDNVSTGIAFNAELSGKKLADIKDQGGTIVLFESAERKRNLSLKYDPKTFGKLPKRFGTELMMIAPLTGDPKMVDKTGKETDINFDGRSK